MDHETSSDQAKRNLIHNPQHYYRYHLYKTT